MSFDWRSLVRSVAPALGATLGGPAGGLAVKFLADQFLGDPEATEQDVAKAIMNASPEKLLELKKLDQDFAIKMKELDIDVERLAINDRKNARQLFKVNIWPQIVLSALFVLGYFSIIGLLIYFYDIDLNDRVFGILNTVIGVLTGAIPMILQFWFGSSLGSKEKSAQMEPNKNG